jgi:hypothetical protein
MTYQSSRLSGAGTLVNDVHSQLNETVVADVILPGRLARGDPPGDFAAERLPIAVSGGWHAMGGQQFCSGGLRLDTQPLGRVLAFDPERVAAAGSGDAWTR